MHSRNHQSCGVIAAGILVLSLVAMNPADAQNGRAAGQERSGSNVKPISRLTDFPDWVTSLAFSPDGTTLVAGSYEEVQLWDTREKKQQTTLPVKSGYARAVAFSPDGKQLAVGSYQSAALWDVAEKVESIKLPGHRGYVNGIAFSPDGKQLATACEDEAIRIWQTDDGELVRTIRGHSYSVNAVAFSPDGKLLASAAGDETRVTRPGEVKLWNAADGEEVASFDEHKKSATGVAFSGDGKHLVSTSVDETVVVYDVAGKKPTGFYAGHGRSTNAALFAADNATVISAGGGRAKGKNDVKIWDRDSGKERATLSAHKAKVAAIALSPDERVVASGGYDKTVILWDTAALLGVKTTEAVAAQHPEGSNQLAVADVAATKTVQKSELRAGIIGLDTSHAIAFTKALNDPKAADDIAGCRVVAAYPFGSLDIHSSAKRVPGYTKELEKLGVEIVDSIDALLERVDVVLLETNDGRPHLSQVIPVLEAGKPVFVDKPIAGSLSDAVAIFEAARRANVPLFSSSSLRFSAGAQAARNGSAGDVLGCDAYSPCSLEATHPDLFWYGIHGVEMLFTVMGAGCESVTRSSSERFDVATGMWNDGRIGTFRGIRDGKGGYGGSVFGSKKIQPIGKYGGYRPLVVEIVKFFRTGKPPVSAEETLQIYAFMEAADESKRRAGIPITLDSVLRKATVEAMATLGDWPNEPPAIENKLTQREKEEGWQLLFNGKDYSDWRCNNDKEVASAVEDGCLVPFESGGYVVIHEKQFGDFILQCDVKMGDTCNSGIFFRIGDLKDPVQTGFELQVNSEEDLPHHSHGAIYDLAKPTKNNSRGPGQWDRLAITCRGPQISVAVNGETVASMNCDDFTEPRRRPDGSKHKFRMAVKDFPRKGYLGFQDHGDKVWFRNVKIRELSPEE